QPLPCEIAKNRRTCPWRVCGNQDQKWRGRHSPHCSPVNRGGPIQKEKVPNGGARSMRDRSIAGRMLVARLLKNEARACAKWVIDLDRLRPNQGQRRGRSATGSSGFVRVGQPGARRAHCWSGFFADRCKSKCGSSQYGGPSRCSCWLSWRRG